MATEPEPTDNEASTPSDALASEAMSVDEQTVSLQRWTRWEQSAREAAVISNRITIACAAAATILLTVIGVVLLPGASKSLVVIVVPAVVWGLCVFIRRLSLRRGISGVASEMRAEMVPALFERVSDPELMNIARTGAGLIIQESKIVRVEKNNDDVLVVVSQYDVSQSESFTPAGSSSTN